MKKSLIFTLAATAMLCVSVFTGCSELPDEYYPSEETKAAQAAANKEAEKDKEVSLDLSTAKLAFGGTITTVEDNTYGKVLSVSSTGDWGPVTIELDSGIDLTGKTITLVAQGNLTGLDFAIGSDDTHRSCATLDLDSDSAFKSYTFKDSDLGKANWYTSATDYYDAVDITNVKTFYIWTRDKVGSFTIGKISYK